MAPKKALMPIELGIISEGDGFFAETIELQLG
jgi:hypothetical protein